jgi:peptide/nickel transport system ATP-binding protein
MAVIPKLDKDVYRLAQIPGAMPRLAAIPRGCAFHPRCPEAYDRCRDERPPLMAVDSRRVAYWLHEEGIKAMTAHERRVTMPQ